MPRGGVTNHIGVQRRSSSFIGHTCRSASPDHSKNRYSCPRSSAFPISSLPFFFVFPPFIWPSFLLQSHAVPNLLISFVTHLNMNLGAVAENNRKKREGCCVKIHRGSRAVALLQHYNSTGNGWLLPKAEAWTCISASAVTPMCFLGQQGYMWAS